MNSYKNARLTAAVSGLDAYELDARIVEELIEDADAVGLRPRRR